MASSTQLLALGCAVPDYCVEQETALAHVGEALHLDERHNRWMQRLGKAACIQKRHLCIPVTGPEGPAELSASERARIYLDEGPPLALSAVEACLEQWDGSREEITHVVTVSCTGAVAPGLECLLIEQLELSRHTKRLGVNFMGCYGAFKGLQVAQSFAALDPAARVLVCCLELCSLHLHPTPHRDTLLANALFADGSAATIIGQDKGLFSLVDYRTFLVPDSGNEMRWDMGDSCHVMRMTSRVPELVEDYVADFVAELIDGHTTLDDVSFAVHPGGKKIVQAVETACSLSEEQSAASWEVLSEYGNMSSPTVLFILKQLQQSSKPWIVMLGFGPGLTVEGYLLKRSAV